MKKNSLFLVILLFIVTLVTYSNYSLYKSYYNQKVLDIVSQLVENNENIDALELASIIKNPQSSNNVLEEYGYSVDDFYLIPDVENRVATSFLINVSIALLIFLSFSMYTKRQSNKRSKEIEELINYLNTINSGNYNLYLNKYDETEFSKLRNALYQTTVLLKEHAEYLKNDRISLKDNIANVSHQLKTPLTSIGLMLESIIDEPDMEDDKRKEFLDKIYIQNEKVHYLVEILLKLSKLDASVIEFKKDKVYIRDMFLSIICSLEQQLLTKNIRIEVNVENDSYIYCDYKWQEEAFLNIIKNCIEYSYKDGCIEINLEENNFYTLITIQDNGCGINESDLPKIFQRFHKSDSSVGFGIGLNLSKTIIEKDNGSIRVDSKEGEYTLFSVKYMK